MQPMSRKSLMRLAIIAPQVCRRSAKRRLFLYRVFAVVGVCARASDVSLGRYRAHLIAFGFFLAASSGHFWSTVSFACICLEVHAPTLAQCCILTSIAFYLSCPRLPCSIRLAAAFVGYMTPLFPPAIDLPGHVSSMNSELFPRAVPQSIPLRKFANLGNSCYMNTALQLLGTEECFVEALRGHDCGHHCVLCRLKADLCRAWPGSAVPELSVTAASWRCLVLPSGQITASSTMWVSFCKLLCAPWT